ncbi:MAG: tRNA lysidine(34) synthetase TilS [Clostridia bacterium]|nr:tRNA lysidine(34) synthetase TilS [Clostridia bacterium]
MQSVLECIKKENLIRSGEIIGVAVSGGSDSMALLHYLNSNKEKFDIEIVAIHFDHAIRENSEKDAQFVENFCKDNGIRLMKTRVNVPAFCEKKGTSIEMGARELRYSFFEKLIDKGIVDKIALAHHISDQAETILMHLFRGSGLTGAEGMSFVRGKFIRPMLTTEKKEIMEYISENFIEYVDDETNFMNNYTRNYIRNTIMPLVLERFPSAEKAIVSFGKNCKEDSDFISKQIFFDGVLVEKNLVKIPLTYFVYESSIINRIIFKALKELGVYSDVERKHIEMIKDLAKYAENGSKIDLPNKIIVHKEYEYITIVSRQMLQQGGERAFKGGKLVFENFGTIAVNRTTNINFEEATHLIDAKKVPKNCVWRYRRDGDEFTKFGGGKKKLKSYFIDKKIPQRLRDCIPLLACDNKILVIAGVEISDDVKIDETTKFAYAINITFEDEE